MAEAWDRQAGEPNRWWQRFERFRLLGPDRSIQAVFNEWRVAKGREVSRRTPESWRQAAGRWEWKRRAEAWDEHCRAIVAAEKEAERLRILSTGFAQQHARVQALDEVADKLLGQVREMLDQAEKFNPAMVEQFRKLLDDLAAEMGERVQKKDITLSGQAVKAYIGVSPDDWDEPPKS